MGLVAGHTDSVLISVLSVIAVALGWESPEKLPFG